MTTFEHVEGTYCVGVGGEVLGHRGVIALPQYGYTNTHD